MARLGQLLREARETRGSSWRDIEAATGLWPEYVQALEREDYSRFASAGHARSALRLYARYLGLNVKEALALWERSARGMERPPEEPEQGPSGRTYRAVMTALVISLALAICGIAALYGYRWVQSSGSGGAFSGLSGLGDPARHPSPTPIPSPTPYQPISNTALPLYTIAATLDPDAHSLAVQQRIDYANRTGETLKDIVLNVFPNYDSEIFTLDGLSVEFGTGPNPTAHSLEGITLHVPLPQDLEPGQVATLFLEYTLDLPYIDPSDSFTTGSLGWSEHVVDVGHWYPALAPFFAGEGWYTFTYHPVGDPYVMEEADYDVRISAPDGVIVVGTGEEEREGNSWRYRISEARSFAFAASDQYVSHTVDTGGMTVTSYYFPEHESAGMDVARLAAEALATFGEEFGSPYPYRHYRVAETEFAGGMEFTGVSFLGALWYETYPGGVRSQLVTLLTHEVSHQWWYGLVGNDQVMEPWLDESLATFSELIFYELRYPHDEQWLWDFEVLNWPRGGPVDGSIYDFADGASYMNAVYRTGALLLADLRQEMGSQQFREFLRDYCQSQSHTLSSGADFYSILSRHADQDLSPVFGEYFSQPPGERAR